MISQIFISRKNKNKKMQFFIASFIIALSLYTTINHNSTRDTFVANFISKSKAQEINSNTTHMKEIAAIKKAAQGFFSHIRFADKLYDMNQLSFKDIQGKDHKLLEFNGKPILINLWAIWCAPCRMEMPELAQLKHDMGGDNFDVIAINVDTTASPEKIQKFLHEIQADHLVYYRDKTMNIFRNIRKQGLAMGLPVTLLIDKKGRLIASLNGSAPWANDDAKALIKAVIEEIK